jgi:hypothetical protein
VRVIPMGRSTAPLAQRWISIGHPLHPAAALHLVGGASTNLGGGDGGKAPSSGGAPSHTASADEWPGARPRSSQLHAIQLACLGRFISWPHTDEQLRLVQFTVCLIWSQLLS